MQPGATAQEGGRRLLQALSEARSRDCHGENCILVIKLEPGRYDVGAIPIDTFYAVIEGSGRESTTITSSVLGEPAVKVQRSLERLTLEVGSAAENPAPPAGSHRIGIETQPGASLHDVDIRVRHPANALAWFDKAYQAQHRNVRIVAEVPYRAAGSTVAAYRCEDCRFVEISDSRFEVGGGAVATLVDILPNPQYLRSTLRDVVLKASIYSPPQRAVGIRLGGLSTMKFLNSELDVTAYEHSTGVLVGASAQFHALGTLQDAHDLDGAEPYSLEVDVETGGGATIEGSSLNGAVRRAAGAALMLGASRVQSVRSEGEGTTRCMGLFTHPNPATGATDPNACPP